MVNDKPQSPHNKHSSDTFRRVGEDYRAGILSLQEISRRHGVHEGTIKKWAKQFGWVRNLTKRVQARATAKLSGVGDLGEEGQADDGQVVERAADTQVAVVEGHRKRSKTLYAIFDKVSAFLDAYLSPSVSDAQLRQMAPRPVLTSTESVGHALHTLATVHGKLVAIERQAYNIDAGIQEKTYEERLKELMDEGELG